MFRRTTRSAVLIACSVTLLLAACGEPEDRSLCPAYESFLATREGVRAIDPTEATAAEVTELFEVYLQQVIRMQEVADGRYTAELDALESATDDVVRTLAAVQDDAEYDTWEPLIDDSLEDVRNASARFEEAIQPTCAPPATVAATEPSVP